MTRSVAPEKSAAGRGVSANRRYRGSAWPGSRIDWPRTLAAKGLAALAYGHLRYRPLPLGGARLHCIVLDCSASMLRGDKLTLAKGLLLAWSQQFYFHRQRFAVIGFSGSGARLLQPPRKAIAFNERWIAPISGGGGTPAASAVALVESLLARQRRGAARADLAVWLLSDVRFTHLPPRPRYADQCTIVDFDTDPFALGRAQQLAHAWQADWVSVDSVVHTRA